MNKKSIVSYIIIPIGLCSALVAISFKIDSFDFLITLAIFTIALLILNLILFFFRYFRKYNLGLKLLPLTSGFLLWLIMILIIILLDQKDTEDEIIDNLETFNKKNGHYPYCQTSSELVDSITINLNYISSNEIKYEFNIKENTCIIKFWNDSIIYNSKNKIKVINK